MTTDFFPGFAAIPHGCGVFDTRVEKGCVFNTDPLQEGISSTDTLDSTDGVDSADTLRTSEDQTTSIQPNSSPVERCSETPNPRRWDAFAFRVRQFTCSLSREHRADVARRPRFYSMPYLRRADDPDLDDFLP